MLLVPVVFFAVPVQTCLWVVLEEQSVQVHLIFAPDQPGRKRMYHYAREAKSLLS